MPLLHRRSSAFGALPGVVAGQICVMVSSFGMEGGAFRFRRMRQATALSASGCRDRAPQGENYSQLDVTRPPDPVGTEMGVWSQKMRNVNLINGIETILR